MSINRIVTRYAKSLFELAKNEGSLERVHQDVIYVLEVAGLKDFEAVMKNPLIKADKKEDIFNAVFKDKVNELTLKTLMVVAEHGREAYLSEICRSFHHLYNTEKSISVATLTTAVEISQAAVENILNEFRTNGLIQKEVELKTKVDPTLIGGFIFQFNDQVYNASISYKLDKLRTKFSENLYIKNF
jgi:F-type H+-transporting ATPase subunit delta